MESITIRITATDQGGYMYDIWKGDQIAEDAPEDSDDGGQCTTTMLNALGMATAQAEELIKREEAKSSCKNKDKRGNACWNCDMGNRQPGDCGGEPVL